MNKTFLLILAVTALMSPSVNGQAKVGTTTAGFLRLSPSVRANGMGAAGVALRGHDGLYFNPALLGLYAVEHRGALAFYPKEANGEFLPTLQSPLDHQSLVLSLPSRWRPWPRVTLGVGFYRTRLLIGEFIQRSWGSGQPAGTGDVIEFQEWAWNASSSLAYDGPVKVAVGLTYKRIHQDLGQVQGKTHAFDYGLAASMPLGRYLKFGLLGGRPVLTPTVGISWANDGPDMELYSKTYSNTYALPSIRRLGAAVELGVDRTEQIGNWRIIGLTVAIESEKYLTGVPESWFKAGVELGIAEAVYLRAGHLDRNGSLASKKTVGFGISSRGLLRLVSESVSASSTKKTLQRMADFVSLEFSYARSDAGWEYADDVSYYELALIF